MNVPRVPVQLRIRMPTAQRNKEVVKISSGSEAVNELLGGGFETRAITEMYGEYRCDAVACSTVRTACTVFGCMYGALHERVDQRPHTATPVDTAGIAPH